MNLNAVHLVGRVGQNPEITISQNDLKIANFSLCTNNIKKVAQWHRVAVFGKQAEVVEKYVKKGDELGVSGEIEYQSYEKDNIKKTSTVIIANRVMLSGKGNGSNDDLPF